MHLDPDMYHIGVTPETVAILKAHPKGRALLVREHGLHHGGAVLSVTPEEYERIASFANHERTVDISRASESCIDMAVRQAFS